MDFVSRLPRKSFRMWTGGVFAISPFTGILRDLPAAGLGAWRGSSSKEQFENSPLEAGGDRTAPRRKSPLLSNNLCCLAISLNIELLEDDFARAHRRQASHRGERCSRDRHQALTLSGNSFWPFGRAADRR